jgi:hypothetical protein
MTEPPAYRLSKIIVASCFNTVAMSRHPPARKKTPIHSCLMARMRAAFKVIQPGIMTSMSTSRFLTVNGDISFPQG